MKMKNTLEQLEDMEQEFDKVTTPIFSPASFFCGPSHMVYLENKERAKDMRDIYSYKNSRAAYNLLQIILLKKTKSFLNYQLVCMENYLVNKPIDVVSSLFPSLKLKEGISKEEQEKLSRYWGDLYLPAHRNAELELIKLMNKKELKEHLDIRKEKFEKDNYELLRKFLKKYIQNNCNLTDFSDRQKRINYDGKFYYSNEEYLNDLSNYQNTFSNNFLGERLDEFVKNSEIPMEFLEHDRACMSHPYDIILKKAR
jgi:hypothetical protein